MKAKSSMVSALQKAQGWETETWECKLSELLERLDTCREDVRCHTLRKNTPEEDPELLKFCRDEVIAAAVDVGMLITQELIKGNDDVLLSVSDGWKNLKKGKPWNPSRYRSNKAERVICGLFNYEPKNGRKPTRKEFAKLVGLSRSDVSEAITLLGIEDRFSDGRQERHKQARRKL
jgi:hypothetical protein